MVNDLWKKETRKGCIYGIEGANRKEWELKRDLEKKQVQKSLSGVFRKNISEKHWQVLPASY